MWLGSYNSQHAVYQRQGVRRLLVQHFTEIQLPPQTHIYPLPHTEPYDVNPFRCTIRSVPCFSPSSSEDLQAAEELAQYLKSNVPAPNWTFDYIQTQLAPDTPRHVVETAFKILNHSPE